MGQKTSPTTFGITARNGLQVKQAESGGVEVGKPGYLDYTTPAATFALEEFFQAKRDAELGRWRWPENPDYVVYPVEDGYQVLRESNGVSEFRNGIYVHDMEGEAAQACRDTHPRPKAWHGAEYGEVWAVTDTSGEQLYKVTRGGRFEQVSGSGGSLSMPITHSSITAAHPVWPADAA